MSKAELINDLRVARTELLNTIADLSDDDMLRAGAVGIWSVKDVLAHLTTWEAELVTALRRNLDRRAKNAPHIVQIEEIDEWNAEQYHLNVQRPLSAILEDFHGVHKYLLEAIEDLDEKTLEQPMLFEWMEGEPLSYMILETAIWHEQEHTEDIRLWYARQQSEQSKLTDEF